MEPLSRAQWLAAVLASVRRNARPASKSPRPGGRKPDDKAAPGSAKGEDIIVVKVAPEVRGIAAGTGREAGAWLKQVQEAFGRRGRK
jgi:hypothetical protein